MQFSRRAFLSLAAAGVVAGAVPADAGADLPAGPGFGFSFDEYLYETGFLSQEEAVAAARASRPGSAFVTAEVSYHPFHMPDELGEKVVDHLLNGRALASDMADWLACANEEGDFEGEFADACYRSDRKALAEAGRASVADALWRAGDAELASAYAAGRELPSDISDGILDAVAADAVLAGELAASLTAFAEANRLADEIRGLVVSGNVAHAAEPALAA